MKLFFREVGVRSRIAIGAIQILRLHLFLKRSRYATLYPGTGERFFGLSGGGKGQSVIYHRLNTAANTPSC
jgi:hypothetical protein